MSAATVKVSPGDALLIVDVQNDFLPGGSLAVPDGDAVIAPLNELIARFMAAGRPVFATRDWHPLRHCSFRAHGGGWPPHCVAHTPGARFADTLELPIGTAIVSKATREEADAYSGFAGTDLEARLKSVGATRLVVGGLATDYCVVNTVRDALALGFAVVLVEDAVRAVDAQAGDGARALAEMAALGALRRHSGDIA